MLRKVPLRVADDLDDVERLISDSGLTIVFDADNTLVPQGVSRDRFQSGVRAAIRRFGSHPSVDRVVVLTNGPDRGVPEAIHRGNKPWTSRHRLGLRKGQTVWVVGDQVLTDGILAWRLDATFVHLAIDAVNEERHQAHMRRVGRLVRRLLFVEPR